mmetsp:Transcript_35469/g.57045  ORF Transcript_35469/g.57045 Transcript_35469/m.57045 type:complete len:237 (-) Transcript_35469:170-880(-)
MAFPQPSPGILAHRGALLVRRSEGRELRQQAGIFEHAILIAAFLEGNEIDGFRHMRRGQNTSFSASISFQFSINPPPLEVIAHHLDAGFHRRRRWKVLVHEGMRQEGLAPGSLLQAAAVERNSTVVVRIMTLCLPGGTVPLLGPGAGVRARHLMTVADVALGLRSGRRKLHHLQGVRLLTQLAEMHHAALPVQHVLDLSKLELVEALHVVVFDSSEGAAIPQPNAQDAEQRDTEGE